MSWFSSLALRLFVGSVTGFGISMVLSYYLVGGGRTADTLVDPWIILLGPMVIALIAALVLPSLILQARWQKKWLPMAEGKRTVPDEKREKMVRKGLRELTGLWILPPASRDRTERYVFEWSRTLLHARCREEWTWNLYAYAWYMLKDDEDAVLDMRALLMESEELDDSAFDVGLSLLDEREDDIDLAILLAKEGMDRDLEEFEPERIALLENAWLAAYAKSEPLRPQLLKILTTRFLAMRRRDEVSGRIYLDAFIAGNRTDEVRNEMRRVADVLGRTGRSPEMTANLRALAGADDGRPQEEEEVPPTVTGTILQPPKAWRETLAPKDAAQPEEAEEQPTDSEVDGEAGEAEKVEAAVDAPRKTASFAFAGGEDGGAPAESSRARKGGRRAAKLTVILGIVVILAAAAVLVQQFVDLSALHWPSKAAPEAQAPELTQPGTVESELPYTVQVAALPTKQAALRELDRLRSNGVDAYFVTTVKGDARWYRLRFGTFKTPREAQTAADSLKKTGVIREYFVARFEPGEIPQGVAAK